MYQEVGREFGDRLAWAEGRITHMDKSSEAEVQANILLILLDYLLLAEYTQRSPSLA
jgi:hypothetical protein